MVSDESKGDAAALGGPQQAAGNKEVSLTDKQRQLQQAKDDAEKLNQQTIEKQAEVKQRQAEYDELARALESYKKCSAEAMQEQLGNANQVIDREEAQVAEAVKQKKSAIDSTIKRFADELKQKEGNLNQARTASEDAAKVAHSAEAAVGQAEAEYEVLKNQPKTLAQSLKDVNGLIEQAGKARAQGDNAAAYFLLQVARGMARLLNIPASDAFETALIALRNALDEAKKKATEAAATAARAAGNYQEAEKKYMAAQASYRSDVLKALKDMV